MSSLFRRLDTTFWVVFTPGFYFDCAVQRSLKPGNKKSITVLPGEFLPHCGTLTESASAQAGGTLVTAHPSGLEPGYITVNCPEGGTDCGAASVLPGTNVSLPPHSIAVPLRNGAVSLSALGPTPVAGQPPKPVWRSTHAAQNIVKARLAEVTASIDRDYPRGEVGQMRDSAECEPLPLPPFGLPAMGNTAESFDSVCLRRSGTGSLRRDGRDRNHSEPVITRSQRQEKQT